MKKTVIVLLIAGLVGGFGIAGVSMYILIPHLREKNANAALLKACEVIADYRKQTGKYPMTIDDLNSPTVFMCDGVQMVLNSTNRTLMVPILYDCPNLLNRCTVGLLGSWSQYGLYEVDVEREIQNIPTP